MRLGFACKWDRRPQDTWSHTPWALLTALRRTTGVIDLGPHLTQAERVVLKACHARRRGGHWSSSWEWSRATDLLCERRLHRRLEQVDCDAVLQVQDLARLPVPYGIYQDLSFDLIAHARQQGAVPQFESTTPALLRRRAERQQEIYRSASTVFAMSGWFAKSLVELSGVPPERVRTVHPGCNVPPAGVMTRKAERPGPVRLLFVGRDFRRKGGDLVVTALPHVRKLLEPDVRLSVVGPAHWPLPGPVPQGVDFLGPRPTSQMASLYEAHDIFVMPSRFEAFGISLVEALAHGVPCVARDAFAMPEVVKPGINGALVASEDALELASAIVRVLGDEDLRRRTMASAQATREYFSWDRAAAQMVATLSPIARAPVTGTTGVSTVPDPPRPCSA